MIMAKIKNQEKEHKWTFFTNHGHVLILLGIDQDLTVREISLMVGITERAVMRIISDLYKENYLSINKVGRKNVYSIHKSEKLRHPIEAACSTGMLIRLIKSASKS